MRRNATRRAVHLFVFHPYSAVPSGACPSMPKRRRTTTLYCNIALSFCRLAVLDLPAAHAVLRLSMRARPEVQPALATTSLRKPTVVYSYRRTFS